MLWHRGRHAQKDLISVERPEYDIVGPSHHQPHKRSEAPSIPLSWFDEPTQSDTTIRKSSADSAFDDAATRLHLDNKRRGNSGGHHARAVPAHRPHKHRHDHGNDDATDKHDHFRHQPHDQDCGNDYHDQLGNLRSSAASDSPLLTVRKLFSAANSSALRGYTYSEAVTCTRRHPRQNLKKRRQNIHVSTPEMNLGTLFFEPTASRSLAPAFVSKSRRHDAAAPEMNLGSLFPGIDSASNQQHPRDYLGRSYGHRGHQAQQDLNPVEGPDYDIERPQHHNGQGQSEKNKVDGFHVSASSFSSLRLPLVFFFPERTVLTDVILRLFCFRLTKFKLHDRDTSSHPQTYLYTAYEPATQAPIYDKLTPYPSTAPQASTATLSPNTAPLPPPPPQPPTLILTPRQS